MDVFNDIFYYSCSTRSGTLVMTLSVPSLQTWPMRWKEITGHLAQVSHPIGMNSSGELFRF